MSFPNCAGRDGGGSPHLPSHGATRPWVPSAPPGTPLECWHPEFWGKTRNLCTGSWELWLIPGGSGRSPCSEHPWMSGVRVPGSACSLSGALGWISHPAHPWRVQPRVSRGVTRLMSHRPFPAPASWEQENVTPWIPRSLSCSGWNGAGSSQPGIPQGLQSSQGAWNVELDLPSWISECFPAAPAVPVSIITPRALGSGTPGSRECSTPCPIPSGILAVGPGCCFPGNGP